MFHCLNVETAANWITIGLRNKYVSRAERRGWQGQPVRTNLNNINDQTDSQRWKNFKRPEEKNE